MDEESNITIVSAVDCISELLSSIDEVEREENKLMVTVAVKLRRLRRALGLTQAEVAEKCGIKQAMVSKLESGDYNPSIGSLFRYVAKIGWEFNITITPQTIVSTQIVGSCDCDGTIMGRTAEFLPNKSTQTIQANKIYSSAWKDTEWSKASNE